MTGVKIEDRDMITQISVGSPKIPLSFSLNPSFYSYLSLPDVIGIRTVSPFQHIQMCIIWSMP